MPRTYTGLLTGQGNTLVLPLTAHKGCMLQNAPAPDVSFGVATCTLWLTGMRTRTPKSLLAGLMWFDPQRPDALNNIRHNAQERDGTALSA